VKNDVSANSNLYRSQNSRGAFISDGLCACRNSANFFNGVQMTHNKNEQSLDLDKILDEIKPEQYIGNKHWENVINNLKAALQKCRAQRNFWVRTHFEHEGRALREISDFDQELADILGGRG